MPRALLFDLDGTLVQTRESSWQLFSRTSEAYGLGINSQEEYFRLMEHNLFSALRELSGSEERFRKVSDHFLDLLRREYNPPFVPGMVDVIKSIAGTCSLAVVSSNATQTIRRILTSAGLQHCFSHVFGGDVEPDKRACVRRFLNDPSYSVNRGCAPAYVESHRPESPRESQVVLITDTVGDVRHAIECGIRVVGVSWGMHTEARLLEAGAEFVAIWPQEIIAHLFPDGIGAQACAAPETADPAIGFVHQGFGSFDGNCGCHASGTKSVAKPCECSNGGGYSCDCATTETEALNQANTLRKARSLHRVGALSARIEHPQASQQPAPGRAGSAVADDLLIASLARLKGAQMRAS
jgi:phosphoglycolate phosphatase